MKIGFIGLGRMGGNMVQRLLNDGHEIVGYARKESSRAAVAEKGADTAASLEELINKLPSPRIVWCMIPAGAPTTTLINQLSELLSEGDIVIDGGNTYFRETLEHGKILDAKKIRFLDAGTSGGIWGLKVGYCMMIGGEKKAFQTVEPLFKALAPQDGYLHVGPRGSGHYVKMVHNGIEYGMLQAFAEGFELLESKSEFHLDLGQIAHLWNQGSVVRSWLCELAESAFQSDPHLEQLTDHVDDSGEGRWTIIEAIHQDVPAPVITASLYQRFRSRQQESFAGKFIAALRNEFGGHAIQTKKGN